MTFYGSFINRQRLSDPTRTLNIRHRWVRDWERRIKALQRVIDVSVVDRDGFGLRSRREEGALFTQADLSPAPSRAWAGYRWSHEKVDEFMKWLQQMEEASLLEIVQRPGTLRPGGEPWSNAYVRSSYQSGMERALREVKKRSRQLGEALGISEGLLPPSFSPTGGAVSLLMKQPFHADRLALAYTRVFDELKGVTRAMDQQISRVLTRGIAEGLNPREIGDLIADRVDKIGKTRGTLIARTETIFVHQQAAINEYLAITQATGEEVLIEWNATMDSRTRDSHAERNGRVYTREEAYGLIGEPNCRCALLPYIPAIQGVPDKASEAAREICEREAKKAKPGKGKKAAVKAADDMAAVQAAPMSSIGDMSNCFVGGGYRVQDRPSACKDFWRNETGEWMLGNEPVDPETIERLNKMAIPPAWKNVVVAVDEAAKIQAVGLDAAGRWQYRYSAEHISQAARIKFNRIKGFSRDIESIRRAIEKGIGEGNPAAYLAKMEDLTAIRVGSLADFKAKTKAYGLTTLKNEFVTIKGDKIILDFVAKEGIPVHYEFSNSTLASWLKERKAATSPGEFLFPDVSAAQLNAFIKECAGGKKYTVKDFRTYWGTAIAREALAKYAGVKLTVKQKKALIKEVCVKVSDFLKNTPAMAKSSYIDPMVWEIIGGLV